MDRTSSKEIAARVRELLLRQWDPIGVADVPEAQDEYDSYVGEIVSATLARQPAVTIADRLVAIETDRLRLPGDRDRALRVAECLVRLQSAQQGG